MMQTLYKGKLTFITPCFLTGADQKQPEIRVPSIRGELRWWFRAVGGTADMERRIFGGVHGEVGASALVLRAREVEIKKGLEIKFSPMSDKGYLYYFASVSGNKEGIHRTQAGAYLAEGSSFVLEILERRSLSDEDREQVQLALSYFLNYGTLGLRATRGCGAFVAEHAGSPSACPGIIVGRISDEEYSSAIKCQETLGAYLRALRKNHGLSGRRESALGYSLGTKRASSSLHLRPIKNATGHFVPVVVYTDRFCLEHSISKLIQDTIVS